MQRKLTTILIADVAGYSRLMAEDELGTLDALHGIRAAILDPKTQEHGGRLIKLMGDGLLMEFSSVVGAVRFAFDVQQAVADHNADVEEDRRIRFRIGINIGDVLVDGDDLYGEGVNLAARLETLAEPGGICVSAAVFEQTRNKLDVTFDDLGERRVKNIPEPQRVYGLRPDLAAPGSGQARPQTPPRPEQAWGSIAVFPFDCLSPDPGDVYLADGLTSEIINMLGRVPDLRVTARGAIASSRDRDGDPWEMANKLDLRYVLTGSLRRAGPQIRVIAELTRTSDRTQLWSNVYQRELADIFSVQEEIASAIVGAFGGEYLKAEWQRTNKRATDSLTAWELVQKARALNLPVNRDAIEEALQLANKALEADPGYAGAHAGLASIHTQRVISGFSTDPAVDRKAAVAAVERAVELAPNDPAILRTLAKVCSNFGHNDRAIDALRRAVEIAPFDFHSWGRLGRTLAYGGDDAGLEEGMAILDRILAAVPNHPMVPYWHYFRANAASLAGRHEDAARAARRSLDLQPDYTGAWMALANALGHLGRHDDARDAVDNVRRRNPKMTPEHLYEQIRVASGGNERLAERATGGLKAAGLL